ncbi:U-box domain-containing protein [Toxoplasma gondii FOU]|uniref:U-box domain-containing protein n=1 Tax=Toxoplasma gondii FOU TaxID=943167 RepID=A0A086JVW2_TOXGO|nr:U-box domain-containing protein [Toxoplasma gondii FOU]
MEETHRQTTNASVPDRQVTLRATLASFCFDLDGYSHDARFAAEQRGSLWSSRDNRSRKGRPFSATRSSTHCRCNHRFDSTLSALLSQTLRGGTNEGRQALKAGTSRFGDNSHQAHPGRCQRRHSECLQIPGGLLPQS